MLKASEEGCLGKEDKRRGDCGEERDWSQGLRCDWSVPRCSLLAVPGSAPHWIWYSSRTGKWDNIRKRGYGMFF